MVIRDIELNVFQTSTCNTTHSKCKFNIALIPSTIVSHLLNVATPNWCGLKCSTNVSLNWIVSV